MLVSIDFLDYDLNHCLFVFSLQGHENSAAKENDFF